MATNTARLLLPYLSAAQAQKHVSVNEALRLLDILTQIDVESRASASPPGSPSEGDAYLVAGSASGDWAGWDGDLAAFSDGAWLRVPVVRGFAIWISDEAQFAVYDGAAWQDLLATSETYAVGIEDNSGNASGVTVTGNVTVGSDGYVDMDFRALNGITTASPMVQTDDLRIPLPYPVAAGRDFLGTALVQQFATIPAVGNGQIVLRAIPGTQFARLVVIGGTGNTTNFKISDVSSGVSDISAAQIRYKRG